MASFLLQVAYTPEAWANMIANPHDRMGDVRPRDIVLPAAWYRWWVHGPSRHS